MRLIRRISSAFKDITGGQILGPTYDYTHRLMDFDIENENAEELYNSSQEMKNCCGIESPLSCPRVSDALKAEGLIEKSDVNDAPPEDVTQHMLQFPAKRSARLQTLSRAETGFVSGLAYSSLRGFGQVHPTVGELRVGYVELSIPYLFDEEQYIHIGEVLITEIECFVSADDNKKLKLEVGYGAVLGRNENKAIAIAVLDRSLETPGRSPVHNEEFVLMHGDSLEMNGFISHLKLPHYVTFQSKLDSIRRTREVRDHEQEL
jgi:alpha-D-ribose 1-methylphosphonate 5-triphosphate synthase subunit PhnI